MKALLRYSFMMYMRNHHYIFPVVLLMIDSFFFCLPLSMFETGGVFVVSVTILFIASLLNGFFSNRICGNDLRAVIVLKTGSAVKYYASNEVLFALLSTGYTILALVVLGAAYLFQTGRLSLRMSAVMLMIHLPVAFFGCQFGSFFRSCLIGKRKAAVLPALVMLLGMIPDHKLSMLPVIRHFLWIVPPIGRLFRLLYTGEGALDADAGYALMQLVIYTLLLLVGKMYIFSRRKWAVYE